MEILQGAVGDPGKQGQFFWRKTPIIPQKSPASLPKLPNFLANSPRHLR
ncbi:hypothetical protein [Microcystis aeruginosa]|nr:hypothetical protein [Microcystis aeruginosa]WNF15895.1 hypothetical protein RKE53_05680 [Microcystis aeruginosa NRERC-214]